MSSPNARTRELYCEQGFVCEIVERHSPFPKPFGKKHDLFGGFDLVAFRPGRVVGVQATSGSNLADRIAKLRGLPIYPLWLGMGWEVHAVGWAKQGAKGKRKVWTSRVVTLTLESHPPVPGDPTAARPAWCPPGDTLVLERLAVPA